MSPDNSWSPGTRRSLAEINVVSKDDYDSEEGGEVNKKNKNKQNQHPEFRDNIGNPKETFLITLRLSLDVQMKTLPRLQKILKWV